MPAGWMMRAIPRKAGQARSMWLGSIVKWGFEGVSHALRNGRIRLPRFPYRPVPRKLSGFIILADEDLIVTWYQREIHLPSFPKGCHDITRHVVDAVPELREIRVGLLHVFIQHTSASLTINENADPDVPVDLDRWIDSVAPEDFPYRHTVEGADDMPGHAKSSLTGCSLSIPIGDGRLRLGTWQGIMLWEHRRRGGRRRLVVTAQGESR